MGGGTKLIVLTGHGVWAPKRGHEAYTPMPARCTVHFYTGNFTLMTEGFGQELEQGRLGARRPVQQAGPLKLAPNMMLTWPRGLTVKPATGWHYIKWDVAKGAKGGRVPTDKKNIVFQIKKPAKPGPKLLEDPLGYMHLKEILVALGPALPKDRDTLIVWSACRQVDLKKVQIDTKIVWDQESIAEFVDDLQLGGVNIPMALKLKMGSWPGRKMTTEDVGAELGADKLIKSSTDPAQAKETWDSAIDDLFDFGAKKDHAWRKEKGGLKLSKRGEGAEKVTGPKPPVPSRVGRPKQPKK